jgi:hypothetical protein
MELDKIHGGKILVAEMGESKNVYLSFFSPPPYKIISTVSVFEMKT